MRNRNEIKRETQVKYGAVIMLAWPETRVLGTGAWYDKISNIIGIAKNNVYKVGHAAFCLVDYNEGEALYYDFGRYQTPAGFGRVRDKYTDPELVINIKPQILDNRVDNLPAILSEIKQNPACHSQGYLISTIQENVNISTVYEYIKKLQSSHYIEYAPFKWACTNCSRFASSAFLSPNHENAIDRLFNKLTLFHFNLPIKQITQKSKSQNVHLVCDDNKYKELSVAEFKSMKAQLQKSWKHSAIKKQTNLYPELHELKGIGANAYFKIERLTNREYRIARYDVYSRLNFSHLFELAEGALDESIPYHITYPSHALRVTLIQNGNSIVLIKKD